MEPGRENFEEGVTGDPAVGDSSEDASPEVTEAAAKPNPLPHGYPDWWNDENEFCNRMFKGASGFLQKSWGWIDPDDRRDLVNEAVERAWFKRMEFNPARSKKWENWFQSSCLRVVREWQRRKWKREITGPLSESEEPNEWFEQIIGSERTDDGPINKTVDQCLQCVAGCALPTLSEIDQKILGLRYGVWTKERRAAFYPKLWQDLLELAVSQPELFWKEKVKRTANQEEIKENFETEGREQFAFEQIAIVLGIRADACRARHLRALKKLRQILEAHGKIVPIFEILGWKEPA